MTIFSWCSWCHRPMRWCRCTERGFVYRNVIAKMAGTPATFERRFTQRRMGDRFRAIHCAKHGEQMPVQRCPMCMDG